MTAGHWKIALTDLQRSMQRTVMFGSVMQADDSYGNPIELDENIKLKFSWCQAS